MIKQKESIAARRLPSRSRYGLCKFRAGSFHAKRNGGVKNAVHGAQTHGRKGIGRGAARQDRYTVRAGTADGCAVPGADQMTRWEETPLTKSQKAAVDRAYTMLGDGYQDVAYIRVLA